MEKGRRSRGVVGLAGIALLACGDKPSANAPPVGALLATWLDAATRAAEPWRCAADDLPAVPDENITTGTRKWRVLGHALTRVDDDREIAIAFVADAGGSAPRTLTALGRLRAQLDARAPDVVVALGGMGTTRAEIMATVGAFSERAPWPVIALPGDLEATSEHVAAIAALRKRGDAVLDGRLVRWIEHPGATLATLPGAGARERLVAGGDGCGWRSDDIARIYAAIAQKPGLRIVAMSEAPRQVVDGEPTGEIALAPTTAFPVDAIVHAPTTPEATPKQAGRRAGAGVVLTPGTADASTRLPNAHQPSIGLLVVKDTAWSWQPLIDAQGTAR